jgi:hypothetical protein
MAATRSRKPKPEGGEAETPVVEAAEPLATPFAGLGKAASRSTPVEGAAPTPFARLGLTAASGKRVEDAPPTPFAGLGVAAPSGKPAERDGLALSQMRLTIEDGLLMVFGPDGDPVPPRAVAAAAATDPAAVLELPDGTTAPAARIAAVLSAQVLGRLGRSSQGSEWILAMLREAGRPEPTSEDALRAEQDAPDALHERDDQPTPCDYGQTAAATADATPATQLALDFAKRDPDLAVPVARGLPDSRTDDGRWFSSLRNLSARAITRGSGPSSGQGAGARGIDGPVRRGARAHDKVERSPLRQSGAGAAKSVAGLPGARTVALGLNPQALEAEGFHMLVVRDVPAGARLSAGAYDPALDGWVMRLRDLGSLMISAPLELHGDFTLTLLGIALRPGDADAVRILAWLPVRFA